jgi:ribosomal protein L11 methyltransferase
MKYTEVVIQIPDEEQLREYLMAGLLAIGYDSFMETGQSVSAYIETEIYNKDELTGFLRGFNKNAVILEVGELPDQNWNAIWESNYEPVVVDNKCVVRAPFHEKPRAVEYDIVIHPKMSFGTAHHSTTFMMIQFIIECDFTGKCALDMGSGTAVLAILASMKGAKRVTAIDNDEWAYKNAIENCSLNDITNIDVIFGNALSIPEMAYDALLANINRNILLEDIQHYNKRLKAGSIAVLSGFYEEDLPLIIAEAEKSGWNFVRKKSHNNWVAAMFTT